MASPPSTAAASLDLIPTEVLENIAYFTATDSLCGPPSSLPTLLLLNRHINSLLSFQNNPHLYARIFAAKFDLGAPLRRLGNDELTVMALADELRWRCRVLKCVKAKEGSFSLDSAKIEVAANAAEHISSFKILWCTYLMMLENDAKNYIQLRDYAKFDEWIKLYWFHPNGASGVGKAYEERRWPSWARSKDYVEMDEYEIGNADNDNDSDAYVDVHTGGEEGALAMWLFWFLLRPETFAQDQELYRTAMYILKPLALGAHKYSLSLAPWTQLYPHQHPQTSSSPNPGTSSPTLSYPFWISLPSEFSSRTSSQQSSSSSVPSSKVKHYINSRNLTPPPLAAPAILSYLSLANHLVPHATHAQQNDLTGVTPLMLPNAIPSPLTPTSPNPRTANIISIGISGTSMLSPSEKWDTEWGRCITQGQSIRVSVGTDGRLGLGSPLSASASTSTLTSGTMLSAGSLSDVWKPGSIEGIWEGMFTYTEFTSYAALLSGAGPHILQKSLVAQHRQTWKLREYHLLSSPVPTCNTPNHSPLSPRSTNIFRTTPTSPSDLAPINPDTHTTFSPSPTSELSDTLLATHINGADLSYNLPLPTGSPTRAFIPLNTDYLETDSGLEINFYDNNHGSSDVEFGLNDGEWFLAPGTGDGTDDVSPTTTSSSSTHSANSSPSSPSARRRNNRHHKKTLFYKRYNAEEAEKNMERLKCGAEGGVEYIRMVRDVIVLGEGHSTWGQFRLMGRVRPYDGFLSITKDYLDGDRGSWLYRGYLVGGSDGNFAGRWRDTLSPASIHGYEGCFGMAQRR